MKRLLKGIKNNIDNDIEIMKNIHGATESEIEAMQEFIRVLSPCLKRKRENRRYETTQGDKTALGLYRTCKMLINKES